MILSTRFRPSQQDADVAAFCGYPRQIRYAEVLISDGVQYVLKKYNAFWVLNMYITLANSKRRGKTLLTPKLLTHEIIASPYEQAYRYVITDGITTLFVRTFNQDGNMGHGFVMYSVLDPHRSLGTFMLPSEFKTFFSLSEGVPYPPDL